LRGHDPNYTKFWSVLASKLFASILTPLRTVQRHHSTQVRVLCDLSCYINLAAAATTTVVVVVVVVVVVGQSLMLEKFVLDFRHVAPLVRFET